MENKEQEYILSVLARNHRGVLLRIAGLFSRRCYSIKSIVAAQTEDEQFSQMIIVVQGDERTVRQVDMQLSKLIEVEQVTVLNKESSVVREHLLLKVHRTEQSSAQLVAIADVFHANILSVSSDTMIVELTGDASTINSFIGLFKPYGIEKMLRTGSMAMEK